MCCTFFKDLRAACFYRYINTFQSDLLWCHFSRRLGVRWGRINGDVKTGSPSLSLSLSFISVLCLSFYSIYLSLKFFLSFFLSFRLSFICQSNLLGRATLGCVITGISIPPPSSHLLRAAWIQCLRSDLARRGSRWHVQSGAQRGRGWGRGGPRAEWCSDGAGGAGVGVQVVCWTSDCAEGHCLDLIQRRRDPAPGLYLGKAPPWQIL